MKKLFGKRLRKLRLERNLTQEQLSEKMDVSVAFLSRIERGNSQVNLKRLTQICEILDIPEGEILTGVSNKSQNYLESEFADLLKTCTPEKQKLIYDIARVIANQ